MESGSDSNSGSDYRATVRDMLKEVKKKPALIKNMIERNSRDEQDDDTPDSDDDEVKAIMNTDDDEDEDDEVEEDEEEKEVISVSSSSSPEARKSGEVIELSSDEGEEEEDEGNPDLDPNELVKGYVAREHLEPFRHGWKREVVKRNSANSRVTHYDIYYIPPPDTPFRTREAKRKRRSKADQEKYFQDFPSKSLNVSNFNYVRKPLGLNNRAYEIIRESSGSNGSGNDDSASSRSTSVLSDNNKKVDYKEVDEDVGLVLSSDEDEDDYVDGLHVDIPMSLQLKKNVKRMRAEHKKRKKLRDPETCCTPNLAEEMLWSELDEDPLGVYNQIGGRSSPSTPPPLRAVKLTPVATAETIKQAYQDIRLEVAKECNKSSEENSVPLVENLASHDVAIRKHKNSVKSAWVMPPPHFRGRDFGPNKLGRLQSGLAFSHSNQLLGNNFVGRSVNGAALSKGHNSILTPNMLRGGMKSGSGSIMAGSNQTVKVKLPMKSINGKRPVVELVMEQTNGKYQAIKFSNNMQVTENIPKALFEQANRIGRTVYQKSKQIPRVAGNRLFLAVNPSPSALINGMFMQQQRSRQQQQQQQGQSRPTNQQKTRQPPQQQQKTASKPAGNPDQVAILVKPQNVPTAKPVLLNVPRRVAMKVKVGTTLSFSASSAQKYVVLDNKIHPPVNNTSRKPQQHQQSQQRQPPKMPVNRFAKLPLPAQLTSSVSIRPLNRQHHHPRNQSIIRSRPWNQSTPPAAVGTSKTPTAAASRRGGSVLSSGEM